MIGGPGDIKAVVHGEKSLICNFIWLKDLDIRNKRQDEGEKKDKWVERLKMCIGEEIWRTIV